jgi:hypothetical protein
MNEIVLKRRLSEATQRVVKCREADMEGLGLVVSAIGDLLGVWTGQKVRIQITAEGQSEAVDMVKQPGDGATQH